MYRDFAQRKASRFSLVGWVRNIPDGRVEILAEGEKHDLELFLAKLHRGPVLARVDGIETQWSDAEGNLSDFHIVYR